MAEILFESYYGATSFDDSIMHYGVKGQKWGTRRWQNQDMSLTPAGRIHYGVGDGNGQRKSKRQERSEAKRYAKQQKTIARENESQDRRAARMDEAVSKGDAAYIRKHLDELSDKEIDAAMYRIDVKKKLDGIVHDDRRNTLSEIKTVVEISTPVASIKKKLFS